MADQTINVDMNVSAVKAAAADFVAAMENQATGVTDLFQKMAQLNKQGDVMRQVITGIATDGSKLTATLDQTKKGWELVSLQVDRATVAMEKFKLAQQNANTIENTIRGTQKTDNLDLNQVNQIEASIQRIKTAVASGGVELTRLQELMAKLQNNPRDIIPNLTAQEAKFVSSYRKMIVQLEAFQKEEEKTAKVAEQTAQRQIEAEAKAALAVAQRTQKRQDANTGETLIRANFAAPTEIARLNAYEQAIQKIKAALESGKVSLERFNELARQIKANPLISIPNLSADEQKVVKALRDIQQATEGASTAGERAKGVFISLGGIFRLLEAQIIKRIFATLEVEILGSVAAAQKLSIAIAEIRTISQQAGISADEWQRNISNLSNIFGNSQADVAEAAYEALSNQVTKARDTFTFLSEAQKFSAATNSTLAQSVSLLSSALKSFNLDATSTERVASIFFKTIELGRVRAKDMADTFGRIGPIAQEVGVKLEEVAAGIATLTVRGTKFSDASTIMSNLLLKLIRPTDEMKKLFAEWGVATGDQAIATFGFTGVLQKLQVEAEKGTGRLGDLFNQIRALRGAFNFTGQGFTDFQKNLDQITAGGSQYQKAIKEVLTSPGKQLEIEMQKIRTLFVDEFGTAVVNGLLDFKKGLESIGLGDFATNIKNIITLTTYATGGWAIYKTAALSAAAANATFTASGAGVAGTLTAIGTGLISFTGFAALGFALGEYIKYLNQAAKTTKELNDEFERTNRIASQTRFDALSTPQQGRDSARVDEATQATQARLQTVLQFVARVSGALNDLKARAIQNQRDTTEALKLSSKTYFDSLNEKIKNLNEKITQSELLIRQSKRAVEDLARSVGNQLFDVKLKYASEGQLDDGVIVNEQKTILLKNKLTETLNRAREEAAKGTRESIEESRKLFGDAEKLQTQLFEQQTSNERRLFEDRVRRGDQLPTGVDSQGRDKFEFVVQTNRLQTDLNRIVQERLKIEQQIQSGKERQIKLDQEAVVAEKEKLRALQEQFEKLEKLSVFSKEGKLKSEFKGPGGTDKALAEFDSVASRIRQLSSGEDFRTQFAVFADLMRQREALVQTVNISQRQEDATTAAQTIARSKETAERIATDTKTALESKRASIGQFIGDLEKQLSAIEQRDLPKRDFEQLFSLGLVKVGNKLDVSKSEPSRQNALDQLELVRRAKDLFAQDQTPERAANLKNRIDELNAAIARYIKLRTGQDASKTTIGDERQTVGERGKGIGKIGDELADLASERSRLTGLLQAAQADTEKLNDQIRSIPGLFDEVVARLGEQAPAIEASFGDVAKSAAAVVKQVKELNMQLEEMNAKLPPLREPPAAPGNVFGGEPRYMSAGGFVGFVPRGSDTVPAMLAKDETVMTGRATSQFAPILEAMNNGTFNRTSTSNQVTNVGDININYTATSGNNAQNIRELGIAMRRAVRRGTVNLTK